MPHVYCLGCDGKIILHNQIQEGDQCICNECDAEFQIVGVDPVEIEWLYEDYDYDDDEDADYDDDDDDESDEDEEDEEWSHLIAKQRRHTGYEVNGNRKRVNDYVD